VAKPNIWEGWYECQVDGCEERIYLLRQEPGPEGWQAQVLHDHEQGAWIVAVFPHTKGQRYWAEVKRMRAEIAAQKKAANEAAKTRKSSRGMSQSVKYWSFTGQEPPSVGTGSPSDAPSTGTPTPAPATTISSDSSSATPATSTETSSTLSDKQKGSTFLAKLASLRRSSDERPPD
jgi:hypothetical protein